MYLSWHRDMPELSFCLDEMEPFFEPLKLYLKPVVLLNISVSLPRLKQAGQSISNRDLIERIKKAIKPTELTSIRICAYTIDVIRFEVELSNRKALTKVINVLDGHSLKVVGCIEPLKIRAAKAKSSFPTRHDWDDFFRNTNNMDQMKPGERPDTIYLSKLPIDWFKDKKNNTLPSEDLLRQIFEQFGAIRCVDIPACDQYRKRMPPSISGIQNSGFPFAEETMFDVYIQFVEYVSFLRAMNGLRNMKLAKMMDNNVISETMIKVGMVDFDKTKHLADDSIQKRQLYRMQLIQEDQKKQQMKEKKEEDKMIKNLVAEKKEERNKRRLEKKESSHLKERQPECEKINTNTNVNCKTNFETDFMQSLLKEHEQRLRQRVGCFGYFLSLILSFFKNSYLILRKF
ncbi:unnamed protein product [Dracunculus medinensis]|uniref:A-kinase anchor protein 17A n=1 Tax=Dracunculus medinensis TaxID=318479 RepID=A0A0N4UJF7_DRAME|nr:unnamed protein product [Dracunculus medinensis]